MTQISIPCIEHDRGRMPKLGLGTWELTGRTCRTVVELALKMGYRHIDTARMYENETEVGRGIADSGIAREDIFLTSKIVRDQLDAEGVRASCEASLNELETPYLDLLLIHWPNEAIPLAETLSTLNELREHGKIRHLGVSNFTSDLLREAVEASPHPIFCNQVEFHPLLDQRSLLACQYDLDIPLVAYCPLAHGSVTNHPALIRLAKKYGKTPAQLALHWIIRHDRVAAIPKSSSEAHLRENLEIFDMQLEAVDAEFVDHLQGAERHIDPDWAPDWDRTGKS